MAETLTQTALASFREVRSADQGPDRPTSASYRDAAGSPGLCGAQALPCFPLPCSVPKAGCLGARGCSTSQPNGDVGHLIRLLVFPRTGGCGAL